MKYMKKEKGSIQYDCVDNIKDAHYYIDIRNYDFLYVNIPEIDVDDDWFEAITVETKKNQHNMKILYIKSFGGKKLDTSDRIKLLDRGVIFSVDEGDLMEEYIKTLIRRSIN